MESLELEDFDFVGYRPSGSFPNSHHTSPITLYPQKLVIDYFRGSQDIIRVPVVRRAVKMIGRIRERSRHSLGLSIKSVPIYATLFSTCLRTYMAVEDLDSSTLLRNSLRTSSGLLNSELKAMESSQPALQAEFSLLQQKIENSEEVLTPLFPGFSCYNQLVNLRNSIQSKTAEQEFDIESKLIENMTFFYNSADLIMVTGPTFPNKIVMINYDQYLMLLDTVCSRFATKLACLLSDHIGKDCLPTWEEVKRVYYWGDDILGRYGFEAYSVLGMFEDIVTTAFVNFPGSDPLGLGTAHTASILADAREIENKYRIPSSHVMDLIEILSLIESPNKLSEIFGLRKHWGHPAVNAKSSAEAVQEKLNEDLPISSYGFLKLHASFNRMVTIEFINKHGEWPKCFFLNGYTDVPIARAQRINNVKLPEQNAAHRHTHWAALRFNVNCVINQFPNSLSILSDKSVSLPRHLLDMIYEKSMIRNENIRSFDEQRRLILEFLRKDHMPVMDIFKVVMSGSVPDSWLANSASMKGGEMKHDKARIFAVLTYYLRQYFAATEEIIKEEIFPYNPHQTMTMNEPDLLSRLREVTSQMDPDKPGKYLHIIHIVDFSKWNLRMKYENTCAVFKSMDDFLGTPGLIEASHDLFSKMVNLVQDRYNPPFPSVLETAESTVWTLHNRGWEGQRQKGWTLLTSALLSDLERLTGVSSTICGQGDNQTLLSKFRVPDEFRNPADWIRHDPGGLKTLLDKYYTIMDRECLSVGLKIKLGESCRSMSYFNYGKRLYFKGVELSMALKRISKFCTEPNDSYPTTESVLKTMNGSEFAANLYSHPSVIPVLVGNVMNAVILTKSYTDNPLVGRQARDILTHRDILVDHRLTKALLSIPTFLGGPPSSSLIASSYRGHPDPGCEDMAWLTMKARDGDPYSLRLLRILESGSLFSDSESTSAKFSLISAPYSLNLNTPRSAKSPIVEAVLPAVQSYCKNPEVSSLYSEELSIDEDQIVSLLSSMLPFHPLIANDIFERSIPGRRRSFVSGLTNTTSLNRLVLNSPGLPILSQIKYCEIKQLEWWADVLASLAAATMLAYDDIKAHHISSQTARDKSWRVPVVGLTAPHPFEQFALCKTNHGLCASDCSHFEREHIVVVMLNDNLYEPTRADQSHVQLRRRAGYVPYMGNRISEGIIQRQIRCVTDAPPFQDAVRINTVRRWISNPGSNFDTLLKQIIGTRTDTPIEVVDLATGIPSRLSYTHRAGLMATKKVCSLSSTSNIASRIYISSNHMGQYSHGEFNYAMPFGPAFLFVSHLLSLAQVYGVNSAEIDSSRIIYHAHVRTTEVPIVYDGNVDIQVSPTPFSDVSSNTPLYSRFAQLILNDYSENTSSTIWKLPQNISLDMTRLAYAGQLIGNSLVEETIIREQVVSGVRSNYAKRESSITIGDLKLVGPKRLIRALSTLILILLPYSVSRLQNEQQFVAALDVYLDNFSNAFWEQFTASLQSERLINGFVALCPESLHPLSSRNHRYLNSILKRALIGDMWTLKASVVASMEGGLSSPLILLAPTLSSLKYMYAKWVEFHVTQMSKYYHDRVELFKHVRDFSHNVLATDQKDLHIAFRRLQWHFDDVCNYRHVNTPFTLPIPVCISLAEPWIDRLRNRATPIVEQAERAAQRTRIDLRVSHNVVNLDLGPDIVTREHLGCDCGDQYVGPSLRSECFFMPSGRLSKSPYRFLECIFMYQLKIKNVICVGTSTGSEACALTNLVENELVYVNCLNDLTMFSPHCASSYIPSAFFTDGYQEKLWKSSEACLSDNDLLSESALASIVEHTRGHLWSGVTCDAELPYASDFADRLILVRNLMTLCSQRVEVGGWLIVKSPISCLHGLKIMVTNLGQMFKCVGIVQSSFSNISQNLVMIVCFQRVGMTILPPVLARIALVVDDLLDSSDILTLPTNDRTPRLAHLTQHLIDERMLLSEYMAPSEIVARHMFLKGWDAPLIFSVATREHVIDSLADYKSGILSFLRDSMYTINRIFEGYSLPRTTVLTLSAIPITQYLNNLFLRVHRSELLVRLISQETFSFYNTEQMILDWCRLRRVFDVGRYKFCLSFRVSRFYQRSSRYLYELLGIFYDRRFIRDNLNTVTLDLHITGTPQRESLMSMIAPVSLSIVAARPIINRDYSWHKRSILLSSLLALLIFRLNRLPGPFSITAPSLGPIRELSARRPDLNIEISSLAEHVTPFFMWLDSTSRQFFHLQRLSPPFIVSVPIDQFPFVNEIYKINWVICAPWTGLGPSHVLIYCFGRKLCVRSHDMYPNTRAMATSAYPRGVSLIGCRCYSCAMEVEIASVLNISHHLIDSLCSDTSIESVRDISHT